MSFSSCYRYIFGLPLATLQEMVRGALSESETAGVPLEFERAGVPIGDGLSADVTASIIDAESAALAVPGTDLDLSLSLAMRLEARVVERPELDPIEYQLSFTLPGAFARDSSEAVPRLLIHFPGVAAGDLGLAISGGEILLTGEMLQPLIDAAIAANPDVLGLKVEPGVDAGTATVSVFSEIFHDDPTTPNARRITGEMSDPSTLDLLIPGHLRAQELGSPPIIDTDMEIKVAVPVVRDDDAGELRVHFDLVTDEEVTVHFDSILPIYESFARSRIKGEVADTISDFEPEEQTIPTMDELETMIGEEVASFAQTIEIGYDMPPPADPEGIDISTFEPATHPGALLLRIEPLDDGTPCDSVDPFVGAEGFSLVMSEPAVRPFLDQVRSTVEGQERTIQGHKVTVTGIAASLHDPDGHDDARGHLWIEGNADVEIDCWPDAGVEFWGPVYLEPRHQADGLYFDATTGDFGAEDDTSCEDVDPDEIAALIESERFGPFDGLPDDFGGIGTVDLAVTSVEIFAAGLVLHGTFTLTTLTSLFAEQIQRRSFWAHEAAAGA